MLKLFLLFTLVCAYYFQTNGQTLNVYEYDSIYKPEPINFVLTDSTDGVVTANYVNYPNQVAYSANYYHGYRTGFVKYFYPNGKLMMTQVFQKSMKNGEFSLYDQAEVLLIKGVYENNVKNGFWAYRKYKFMGEFKNGLKDGTWKFTQEDGKKLHYQYKKGVLKKTKVPIPLPKIPNYLIKEGVIIVP